MCVSLLRAHLNARVALQIEIPFVARALAGPVADEFLAQHVTTLKGAQEARNPALGISWKGPV